MRKPGSLYFPAGIGAGLGSVYASNALAQEKTGEFWVDGQLFGRPSCHTAPDFEHAEVAVFVGKNPWQSHGFPRARAVLREIAPNELTTSEDRDWLAGTPWHKHVRARHPR